MKKILFSLFAFAALSANAQVQTIFEDSFEAYEDFSVGGINQTVATGTIGEWTLIDSDRSATYGFTGVTFPNSGGRMAYIVFNNTATTPPLEPTQTSNWTPRTGSRAMASFAAAAPTYYNNDFLISPAITLGESDNVLRFYAKAADSNYGMEIFSVKVSTTDTQISSFTEVAAEVIDSNIQYALYEIDLSEYNGQTVHIAINCESQDQFGFVVDDFSVSGSTLATSDLNQKNMTKVFPNPAKDVINVDYGANFDKSKVLIEISDMTGRVVKTFADSPSYDISDLGKGVYVVRITDGTNKVVKKLIKN